MADKIRYGISNVHIGLYTVAADGTVTMGTPMHIPGAVSMSMDPESEENVFYADNTAYYTGYSDNGYTGELVMALFPDAFLTTFMNYVELADGGIAQIKGGSKPSVYIAFQGEGDQEGRRGILYNVSLGSIQQEHNTKEDTVEPDTETLPFTCSGDNKTGIVKVGYPKAAAGYATLFTNPPAPVLPVVSQ
jgi:phi13 family phage major tail protein